MPATSQIKNFEEPLIKPKEEPIDPNDEENTSHSGNINTNAFFTFWYYFNNVVFTSHIFVQDKSILDKLFFKWCIIKSLTS